MNEARTTYPSLPLLPEPPRNRRGSPLPAATIELLLMAQGLLVYASDLRDLLRQAAAFGLSLLARCFGSAQAGFVLNHLTRGILRAIALEHVLLAHAEGQPDPAAGKPHKRIPCARQPTAPLPSGDQAQDLPTLRQLEAAIRRRPVTSAIDDICRDLGVSFSLCEARFGNALRDMLAAHRATICQLFNEFPRREAVIADAREPTSASGQTPRKHDAIRYIVGYIGAVSSCGFPLTAAPVGAAIDGAQPP